MLQLGRLSSRLHGTGSEDTCLQLPRPLDVALRQPRYHRLPELRERLNRCRRPGCADFYTAQLGSPAITGQSPGWEALKKRFGIKEDERVIPR